MSVNDETARFNPYDIQENKGIACLSYLGILFLIPMLVKKESAYCQFHVNQGIVLFIFTIILSIVSFIVLFIPFMGFIGSLLPLISVAFVILGIVNAYQGQAKRLPIIGNIQIIK